MNQQIIHPAWGTRSPSFWLTFFVAIGILFIGARFIVSPHAGALGYGIGLPDDKSVAYGYIKGIRDIFSGLIFLILLQIRAIRATAWLFGAAILIPAGDCLIVFISNGGGDQAHLWIHGGTAIYMIFTDVLLFRDSIKGLNSPPHTS
jgi:hypothetical protein